MESDRELLEWAAKAAGIALDAPSPWFTYSEKTGFCRLNMDGTLYTWQWNPLHDDGDALRLAVKLGMQVMIDVHPDGCECSEAFSVSVPPGIHGRAIVNHDGDVAAATRRAIVRAAAEIGKEQSNES